VDELDFWGGTFLIVLFATIEVLLFAWVFGMDNAWDEIHKGADMRIPAIYKFIIKYITPLFLLAILSTWFWQEWRPILLMERVSAANKPYIIITRICLLFIFALLCLLVRVSWRRKRSKGGQDI